ncbi:hypothetical protein REJC140_03847 [Pseudorhizobium endolithicum]|uniref:Uncharacterized protein n=1 Tax=Pseudorhizobium endolithicum TaxID=1191678 RepID=A0ABM8PRK0_9HYPH|nr:hypothetical protein [Pseudorhizobium endolithicum]CAD7044644.1 hypothetical protein REJC140_03847 [Pseudorhizobium endolithicum]
MANAARNMEVVSSEVTEAPGLLTVISNHIKAREKFLEIAEEEERQQDAFKAAFKTELFHGPFKTAYDMHRGSEWVKEQITTSITWYISKFREALGKVDEELLSTVEERMWKLDKEYQGAVDAAYGEEEVKLRRVERRYDELSEAELEALMAVCAHVCVTPEEAKNKADYLLTHVRMSNMQSSHLEAVLKAMKEGA